MSDDEIIAVVQAHKDGKQIQYRGLSPYHQWHNCRDNSPLWNFPDLCYRVKPEPLECWANIYAGRYTHYYHGQDIAIAAAGPSALRVAVHMREVEG